MLEKTTLLLKKIVDSSYSGGATSPENGIYELGFEFEKLKKPFCLF